MTSLSLSFGSGIEVLVDLRAERTATVERLLASVPFKAKVNRWGDEVYFETPVTAELEKDARALMEVGEVAFWPDGSALALFFGPTPASTDDRPRAYSACNMIGKVRGDPEVLKGIRTGASVEVSESG